MGEGQVGEAARLMYTIIVTPMLGKRYRESLVSEKEMGIIVRKGSSFQKCPIQEYGKRATFASFVLLATNRLPMRYLVFMTPCSLTTHFWRVC